VFCKPAAKLQHVRAFDQITIDPEQMHGRPCIRGLRISVADILHLLSY
jgi:uncharacterized protein (DUF433 family)